MMDKNMFRGKIGKYSREKKIHSQNHLNMDTTTIIETVLIFNMNKIIIYKWPLMALLEEYTAYSLSVSAMEILGNRIK